MVTRDEFEHLISLKDFDQVMKGKGIIPDREISTLREGDLISRNMNMGGSPSYHAGIYCGNEEVISFTAPSGTKRWFLPQQSATVIKESVTNFLNGKSYEVFRLKSGIPGDFSNSVKKWMKYNEEYDLRKNNCLHFARRLLELPAEPHLERNSQSDGESTRASESQIQTLQHQEPQVQFVANSEEPGSVTLPSSSHEPNSPESTDDVKKPTVKNDEEGQSLLKPETSESTTNEDDETADDVKKPTVKNDEEGQSLLKPETSESTTNEDDETADDVKKPTVKTV